MVATKSNTVNPLNWQVPIVNKDGTPTNEFMRKWQQQGAVNGSVPNLALGQPVHYVFAASPAGPASPPAFRLLVAADIPALAYDALGAAATAQTNAETFATAAVAAIPHASATVFGLVKVDNTTITAVGGVISSVGGGSSGGAASIQDSGTAIKLALSDANGQLVLDGSGNPVFVPEVFPAASLPFPTLSSIGGVEAIAAVTHNFLTAISTAGVPALAQPATTDLSDCASGSWTPIDASGAGLTFGAPTTAHYIKTGKLCFVFGYVQTPANSSGLQWFVGGLPFTVSTLGVNGFVQPVDMPTGGAGAAFWFFNVNTTTAGLGAFSTGGAVSNANAVGGGYFAVCYPTV